MNATASATRVLVVDDEPSLLDDYRLIFGSASASATANRLAELEADLFGNDATQVQLGDIELTACQQGADAVAAVSDAIKTNRPYAIAFIDLRMPPGLHGLETAAKIRAIDSNVYFVFVTAYSDLHPITIGELVPPADRIFFIHKPFHALEIQQFVHGLGKRWRADRARQTSQHAGASTPSVSQHLLSIAEHLPAGLALFDGNDRLIGANRELGACYGGTASNFRPGMTYRQFLELIRGSGLADTSGAPGERWLQARLDWHKSPVGSIEQSTKDGRTVAIFERKDDDGRSFSLHVDVTDLGGRLTKSAQRRLLQEMYQEMEEGVVRLATTFGSAAETLSSCMEHQEEGALQPLARETLLAVRQTQQRLESVLRIAGRRMSGPVPVDIGKIVQEARADLEEVAGKTATLDIDIQDNLWPVMLNPEQLCSALGELIENAVRFGSSDGRLRIQVRNTAAADSQAERVGVLITVTDSGTGMRPEILERIPRPFFTTRHAEGRLGLGLAAVHSFVLEFSGEMSISSREGHGTTVELYFPKHQERTYSTPSDGDDNRR